MADDDALTSVLDAMRDLGAARTVSDVTAVIRRAARRLTGADGITFVVREADKCHYIDEDAISPLWTGQRFPLESCVSGLVMISGTAAVIPDVYADTRVPTDAYAPTFVKSMAMVPVGRPAVTAAIGAYWAAPHQASVRELTILQRLADVAGVALENIRLFDDLHESQQRFAVMANTSPVMIWVTDGAGQIAFVNHAYCAFFGVEPSAAFHLDWQTLLHPDDLAGYVTQFVDTMQTGQDFSAEARVRRADGQWRWIHSYASCVRDADGNVTRVVGSSPDVTPMKVALGQATRANRLKDEFLAAVSHELRQPLHAASAALAVMKSRTNREAGERAREIIARQLQHMIRLVDDLLDASRIVRGEVTLQRAPVNVGDLVLQIVEATQSQFDAKRQRVHVAMSGEPLFIEADPARLQQVVSNLLSNASKYTPDGGRIDVSMRMLTDHVEIAVRDTGIGIAEEDLPYIFDMFARGKSVPQDTSFGIGLAVTKSLVQQHNGSIHVRSGGLHTGSTFTVHLPAVPTVT
jgi:PAS domain S-box-containing protein